MNIPIQSQRYVLSLRKKCDTNCINRSKVIWSCDRTKKQKKQKGEFTLRIQFPTTTSIMCL